MVAATTSSANGNVSSNMGAASQVQQLSLAQRPSTQPPQPQRAGGVTSQSAPGPSMRSGLGGRSGPVQDRRDLPNRDRETSGWYIHGTTK
jgi:hypothetical protein